jgi:hypothetical protein
MCEVGCNLAKVAQLHSFSNSNGNGRGISRAAAIKGAISSTWVPLEPCNLEHQLYPVPLESFQLTFEARISHYTTDSTARPASSTNPGLFAPTTQPVRAAHHGGSSLHHLYPRADAARRLCRPSCCASALNVPNMVNRVYEPHAIR